MQGQAGLHVVLVTGRTIEQGVGKERGKASAEYFESASACFMDPEDMKKLAIKENSNVCVSTSFGSVVLKALESASAPHKGIIFVPYGPWANVVVDPETSGVGMPSFKGIPAHVEASSDRPVLKLDELLRTQFRKGQNATP